MPQSILAVILPRLAKFRVIKPYPLAPLILVYPANKGEYPLGGRGGGGTDQDTRYNQQKLTRNRATSRSQLLKPTPRCLSDGLGFNFFP